MVKLARVLVARGFVALLRACTAAGGLSDNNCSGQGWIDPGAGYCGSYTQGGM